MSRYKRLPITELIVDDRYQRALDPARVQRMADSFDERLFGTLEVNQRNGHFAVFDGQHRLEAAKLSGRESVPCLVHSDLTPEGEADLFVQLQAKRKGIQPVDRFRARVFGGDPIAVEINDIVERTGFHIRQGSGYANGQLRNIAAIGALERVHKLGVLHDTLTLLTGVWGGDAKSTDGWIIEGLGIVYSGYGHRIGESEIAKLREIPPVSLMRRAVGKSQAFGANPATRGVMVAHEIRKVLGLRGAPKSRKASS